MPDTALAPCQRCATLAPRQRLGALWVCAACVQVGWLPTCGPSQHEYHGWETGWLCYRCGTVLTSTPMPTAVVEAPTAPLIDYDC